MSDPEASNPSIITVVSEGTERPAARDACLVVIYGMDLGKRYKVGENTMTIGRSSKTDVQVDQESVSRNHCSIINTGQTMMLRDLGSTNGTYVNQELVDEYVLRDGDFIKVGRCIFKFLVGTNIENAYHEEIYRLTTIDGLTQIFNKRYFVETLEREIGRAQRYRRQLSLIMLDIDHFKQINDTHGHLAGDHILRQLATTIKTRIRREDILARYGGEEFAIILPELDRGNSIAFAEKVRLLVQQSSFEFEETRIPITVSIGVATLSENLPTPGDLIKIADTQLYKAKEQGRNRVVG